MQRKMMINFTVICLQPNCGEYQAQVNYTLNMKLTILCLFRVKLAAGDQQLSAAKTIINEL